MKRRKEQIVCPELSKDELRAAKREFRKRMKALRVEIASATIDDLRRLVEK